MGIIYRFVTRTVLHNFIVFIKFIISTVGKYRKSITFSTLVFIIFLILTVALIGFVSNSFGVGGIIIMSLLMSFDFLLFMNLVWTFLETTDRWNGHHLGDHEPEFVKKIGRGIRGFCKEVSRSNDEQEEMNRKRKKEIRKKKLEVKGKKAEAKRKKLEIERVEKNAFNRFEVMEID